MGIQANERSREIHALLGGVFGLGLYVSMLLQPMRGAGPVDGESENGHHFGSSKKRHPQVILSIVISYFVLFTQMLAAVDSFQKPAIKGFNQRVRFSERVLPPGTRICIFAIVCLYPSYPIDRTGKMVRTLFYTHDARDTNVKIYFKKASKNRVSNV